MTVQEPDVQPMSLQTTAAADASGEAEAGGMLTIDLAAIAANWKRLYGMTVPVECAAVVKADAYGCGIEQVVPRARQGRLPDFLRGRSRRRRAACARSRRMPSIYVLNGLMPGTAAPSPTSTCGR